MGHQRQQKLLHVESELCVWHHEHYLLLLDYITRLYAQET